MLFRLVIQFEAIPQRKQAPEKTGACLRWSGGGIERCGVRCDAVPPSRRVLIGFLRNPLFLGTITGTDREGPSFDVLELFKTEQYNIDQIIEDHANAFCA